MTQPILPHYVKKTNYRKPWSDTELRCLRYYFPHKSTVWCARELGRGLAGVTRQARLMGLRKSPEYLTKMGRRNIRGRWANG